MDIQNNDSILVVSENPISVSKISSSFEKLSTPFFTLPFSEIQSETVTLAPNIVAVIVEDDNCPIDINFQNLRYPNYCNALIIGWTTGTKPLRHQYDKVLTDSDPVSKYLRIIELSATSNRTIRALQNGSHHASIAQIIQRINQQTGVKISSDNNDDHVLLSEILSTPSGLNIFKDFLSARTSVTPIRKSIPEILLIEDEDEICEMTREYFEYNGFPIHTATTLVQAKQIIDDNPALDIIFLDYSLPDGNGIALLQQVMSGLKMKPYPPESFPRLRYPDIVITSAYTDQETIDKCMNADATAYLSKPVSLKSMVETSIKLFERRNLLKEIQNLSAEILQ